MSSMGSGEEETGEQHQHGEKVDVAGALHTLLHGEKVDAVCCVLCAVCCHYIHYALHTLHGEKVDVAHCIHYCIHCSKAACMAKKLMQCAVCCVLPLHTLRTACTAWRKS